MPSSHMSEMAVALWTVTNPDSQHGSTALICVAQNGRAECARLLIDAGADTDVRNYVRVSR
jgi:ankyrin repeat protein